MAEASNPLRKIDGLIRARFEADRQTNGLVAYIFDRVA
jgi:hypothetical protein